MVDPFWLLEGPTAPNQADEETFQYTRKELHGSGDRGDGKT